MAITKIVVTAHIVTDRLFAEEGYAVEQSAENLADLQGDGPIRTPEQKPKM